MISISNVNSIDWQLLIWSLFVTLIRLISNC